jgi:hypothetical protein
MDQNLENKIELKERIIIFCKKNKLKIYLFITFLLIFIASMFFWEQNKNKKNSLIAEKFITADLFLSSNNSESAKKILQEIILSKNKFYSILALNTILENNLISDKKIILEYFNILQKINFTEETQDIIALKKALYLIKVLDTKTGNNLLTEIIKKDSNIKSIALDILGK